MNLLRSKRAIALATTGAVLAVVGVAYATIPDSSGVVNTCYRNGNGDLRAVDAAADCRKNETHLPLGSPTRAYAVADPDFLELGETSATVASVSLPAGRYLAHAKVNVTTAGSEPGSTFIPCSMRIQGTTTNLDQTWIVLPPAASGGGSTSASIGLQAAVSIPSGAVLEVICASIPRPDGPATGVFARYRQLDAISVDTLTASFSS
jgi:hypothetical protein